MAREIWYIAQRNVIRQLRRFLTVMTAVVFGIVIISLIQGVLAGVDRNIYSAAGRYYGGDVLVMGTRVLPFHEDFSPAKDSPVLQRLADQYGDIVRETNFRMTVNFQGTFFYQGTGQQQKRINGIDWEREVQLFQDMDFLEKNAVPPDTNSVILSKATVERLQCQLGSSVLLQITRTDGQVDTVRLVVWGIYRDSAVFGPYNAYVSRKALNRVLGNNESDFSIFTLKLKAGVSRSEFAHRFNQAMSASLPALPAMHSRNEYNENKFNFVGVDSHYSAMPVDFSVDQLNQLNAALMSGLMVLMVFIALTVAVGTFNTYRIMLDERSRELGSMRAMGLTSTRLRNLILAEGLIIAVICSLSGLFVSMLVMSGLSYAPLGKIPGLDLFLNHGQLKPVVSWAQYAMDLAIMILMLEFSAWMAAWRVRNLSPMEAINRR